MGTNLVDPDYKIKYKHLFRTKAPYISTDSLEYKTSLVIKEFNKENDSLFFAEDRVLIPGDEDNFSRKGIILEHRGDKEDFEKDFSNHLKQIEKLAKKLDSITCIYEYSFKTEFCQIDRWVEYEGHYVAYNLLM